MENKSIAYKDLQMEMDEKADKASKDILQIEQFEI